MYCVVCGKEITAKATGRPRKTCSGRCRTKLSRQRARQPIPETMVSLERWVRADGKRPITPSGAPASSTDPATWCGFMDVLGGAGDGYGVMLGDGLGCYDLDDALADTGELKEWARAYVGTIEEPIIYAETSVSARGLHIFIRADEAPGYRVRVGDGTVERYTRGRFIRCGQRFKL